MAERTFHTDSPDETRALARELLAASGDSRIFAIFGDLGAGKTTLVQGLCEALGIEDDVTSPTFSIVNEYAGPGVSVFHFDFYRIKDPVEAYDLGYEEYFDSGAYCFIEWPEMIADLVPIEAATVRIDPEGSQSRNIHLSTQPA